MTNPILAMKTFGASAPLKELQKKFGFTTDHVIEAAKQAIAANR
jgi:transketolase